MLNSNLKGSYVLIVKLEEAKNIEIGRLGVFLFPRGYYAYTGSAMNGISQRVRRHISQKKKLRWHIDYLLSYGKVEEAIILGSEAKIECGINQMVKALLKGRIIAPGFGSSDCKEKCGSHLLFIQKYGFRNHLEEFLEKVRKRLFLSPCHMNFNPE
jgi:Uri superfamily endonuclease